MNTPIKDGYYWMRNRDSYGNYGRSEIVYVAMTYTHRNKVIPYILARFWKAPLSAYADPKLDTEWSSLIECPFDMSKK